MEATARKPGNVHPGASFADLTYNDLIVSANVIAPILAATRDLGIGQAVLKSVQATDAAVGCNSNLGIILLLAPLAAIPTEIPLVGGISAVLNKLSCRDAKLVFQAIRIARPGGMGRLTAQDISQRPTDTLMEIMCSASDRDLVAAQYANNFELIFTVGMPLLEQSFNENWQTAIIRLHLTLMASHPDTLIARKCGLAEARQSAILAQSVLDARWPNTPAGRIKLTNLDNWLRARDNRRNPGTTADLITACLFAALREEQIKAPPNQLLHQSLQDNRDA